MTCLQLASHNALHPSQQLQQLRGTSEVHTSEFACTCLVLLVSISAELFEFSGFFRAPQPIEAICPDQQKKKAAVGSPLTFSVVAP